MRKLLKYFLFVLLILIINNTTGAQKDKARVFAAYINKFAQYTTWRAETTLDSFRIAVFSLDQDIIDEFKDYASNYKIKNKPIALYILKSTAIPKKLNIILITNDKSKYLPDIYDQIEDKHVLLVSEEYSDKRSIMINLYKTKSEQVLFEVNTANIINQELTIDPEILLSGGTEIDVANLYRKSQVDLRSMQKNLELMSDSLNNLKKNVLTTINQIEEQEKKVAEQKSLLSEHLETIFKQQEEINTQKATLNSRQAILKAQQDSIAKKNSIYFNQLKDIKQKSLVLVDQEKILKSNQYQINLLNKDIYGKNLALGTQTEIINQQNKTLFLLYVVGALIFVLVITIFVSYRKNRNKSNKLAKQKQQIEEKLIELEILNEKLQQADQYKSIFLASMSHELRTPLNSIIGYTGILLMGMTGSLNDEQSKQLTKVKNNAKHLLSLINDILDISKIEADRVELNCEEFSLKALIDEVVETIQPKVTEKGLMLTTHIGEDIAIFTDKRRIMQVILNLVSNAVNYSESGDIYISTEKLTDNKFQISVKDTGIGIADSELARLFQPFQQIDSSLTKKNSGTGLGLYLSRKIMIMLGGDIFVKSELGKGSDFYLVMPVKHKKD